jgi:hypothetical protein
MGGEDCNSAVEICRESIIRQMATRRIKLLSPFFAYNRMVAGLRCNCIK